jgi:hypothetical protein
MRRFRILVAALVWMTVHGGAAAPPAQAAWGQPDGCGTGGWVNDLLGVNPYNAQFRPACDLHDWCYGGAARPVAPGAVGDWYSRKRCDDLFLQRMLATCGAATSCRSWAGDYYEAVRAFGDSVLFGHPYTTGQQSGQANLLPNASRTTCSGCSAGVAQPTLHVDVRGSNTTYWKLDAGGWHKIACQPWDPSHLPCVADVVLQVAAAGSHALRIKAVDAYTGAVGRTWLIAGWTS